MTLHARTFVHTPVRPKRAPPPQRAKVLTFIQAELAAGRPFPSYAQITAQMGWNAPSSARSCLEGLRRDGWVRITLRGNNRTRPTQWETI